MDFLAEIFNQLFNEPKNRVRDGFNQKFHIPETYYKGEHAVWLCITAFICLATGAFFDIRTHTENIPLPIFPTGIFISFCLAVYYHPETLIERFVTMFVFILFFWIWKTLLKESTIGGADELAVLMLAMNMGVYAYTIFCFALFLCIPHSWYAWKKQKTYPFLPYLFTAYLLYVIYAKSCFF